MLNFKEQVNKAIDSIEWSISLTELKIIDLKEKGLSAVYVYEDIKGGKSIIVDDMGEALIATSRKSLNDVLEDFKQGKRTDINIDKSKAYKYMRCPSCGNITSFDLRTFAVLPVKFDYKCSKCGTFHKIKLDWDNKDNDSKSLIEWFNENIFTIENKKDPVWEKMSQSIADNVIENLVKLYGDTKQTILVKLRELQDIDEIEEFIISQGVELPTSANTKKSVLEIFKDKIINFKK